MAEPAPAPAGDGLRELGGSRVARRLVELGIVLPRRSAPPALYSPYRRAGRRVSVAGQPPYLDGELRYRGKVGADLSLDDGIESARLSALNVLAHLLHACAGNLDRVACCVDMIVFVNAAPDFHDVHKVADGASALLHQVFDPLGPPARSSLGCAVLPMDIATEVQASFYLR
jgi:enamine deaminase RidA (YjgF/YER057c/UK114 family)